MLMFFRMLGCVMSEREWPQLARQRKRREFESCASVRPFSNNSKLRKRKKGWRLNLKLLPKTFNPNSNTGIEFYS